jgi:hypothetical protein
MSPFLFHFNEFLLHKDFQLIFHLINARLKFENFLFHAILPSKLIHGSFVPVVFYHGQYFFLQFFHFPHHFLFSLIVDFSFLGN